MRFIDPGQLVRSFTRKYEEEASVALTAIDCVLNGEKAVYASSELTTGRRMQKVLREIGATHSEGLRRRLGAERYRTSIWDPNVEQAMSFARDLHHRLGGNQLVVSPAPFATPDWTQQEYLSFWETLLRTRIKAVYFNAGWEFSSGCSFEYLVSFDAGLPTYDASGAPLPVETAVGLIERAIGVLRNEGLDADSLVDKLTRLSSLAS